MNHSVASIEFPFRLESELTEFSVAADLHVRRMDDEAKSRLLRIKKVQYDEQGRLICHIPLPGCLLSQSGPLIGSNIEFCSSNFMLVATCRERAVEFNLGLKLLGDSLSSLYIGYHLNGAKSFLTPPCYYGNSALVIAPDDPGQLSRLVALIASQNSDKKLQTMSEIYLRALSPELRQETRFIEFTIILEMLLLPKASTELSYRFSLRLAKLVNKLFGESINHAFERGRSVYNTRSRLVHSGSDTNLTSVLPIAYHYARTLLAEYIYCKSNFDEASLDALCLAGLSEFLCVRRE